MSQFDFMEKLLDGVEVQWKTLGDIGNFIRGSANHADRAHSSDRGPRPAAAKRAFDAMMEMSKIDIAAIEAARRG